MVVVVAVLQQWGLSKNGSDGNGVRGAGGWEGDERGGSFGPWSNW